MDNVTQQRLLNNKLWDLSKERYRFLSENAFQKKMFLKKQARKSKVFQGMLEGLNIDGARISYSEDALRMRAGLKGPESTGARMALLERMEPKKSKPQKESSNKTDNNNLECASMYNSNSVNQSKIAKSVKFNREELIVTPKSHLELKETRWPKLDCAQWEPYQQITKSMKCNRDNYDSSEKSNDTFWRTSEFKNSPGNESKSGILPAHPSYGRHLKTERRRRSCRSAPELTTPIKDRRYLSLTDMLSERNILDKDIAQ